MKLEELLQGLPSKDDVARSVGLEARSSTTADMAAAFAIFGTGLILGAGLALLFAPQAGDELRRDITEKVGEAGERLRAHVSPAAAPTSPSVA